MTINAKPLEPDQRVLIVYLAIQSLRNATKRGDGDYALTVSDIILDVADSLQRLHDDLNADFHTWAKSAPERAEGVTK